MFKVTLLSLLLFSLIFSSVQASGSAIGVQIEDFTVVPWQAIAQTHAGWIKVQAFSEDQPGILHYHPLPELLTFIGIAHSKGYKVLVSAEGYRHSPIGHLGAYLTFLGALGSADAIEIWNEENSPGEFNGTPQDYATVERAAIKAIPKGPLTIIGALQPSPTEQEWSNTTRTLPGECVGIHYEDWPFHNLAQRLHQLSAFYGGRSLCFTEVGVLSGKAYSNLSDSFFWAKDTDRTQQAKTLREIVNALLAKGKLVIIFNVGFTTHGADPMDGYNIFDANGVCAYC